MPTDVFDEYFTPERLERLLAFRKRFPHWCSDWPSVAAVRAVLTPGQRIACAVREMREDLKGWENPPELAGDLECEAWIEGQTATVGVFEFHYADEGIAQVDVEVPAFHTALFASIAYALRSDHSKSEREHLLHEWSRHVEGILVSDPQQSEKRGKLLKLAVQARSASARAAQSCPPRERQKRAVRATAAADALKSYWHTIGQDIGLIPTRRGGKADLISEKWLSKLANQAKKLLVEVRGYEVDMAERDAVRGLLLAKPYPVGSRGTRSVAAEHLKRGRTQEDAHASWDSEVNLDAWCLRLAFPMLTADDLRRAAFSTRAWRWLPAGRLGVAENALSKRLSKYRRRS